MNKLLDIRFYLRLLLLILPWFVLFGYWEILGTERLQHMNDAAVAFLATQPGLDLATSLVAMSGFAMLTTILLYELTIDVAVPIAKAVREMLKRLDLRLRLSRNEDHKP
jgi:mannose/fructose/N-acetylgalactosamine-specific phosphotransferase system component IIC